ncbi:alpha/beta fold hydrolase [Nocardioides sp. CN2-186]|uniref:alpha/beta hydrolase n=1 Tax=Nocardioides tweenelious TaxID=3156607 RepID=UPI0032B517A7
MITPKTTTRTDPSRTAERGPFPAFSDASRDITPTVTSTRSTTLVVVGSLMSGLVLAALLCLLGFPGATEAVITGSVLIGFGVGWALLAGLSARSPRRQRWAWVPAVLMTTAGILLLAVVPGPKTMSALGWVWPPVLAATALYCVNRMRRDLPGRGRLMLYPVLAGLVLASAGGLYTQLAAVNGSSLPAMPGHAYEIDGRRLHLDCRGSGSPTVVVESGLAGTSASWARVVPEVAKTSRICAYDRAGQGWSEEGSRPHDGLQAAHDLEALLQAAGEVGPFVLAGHSTGGTYVMTYAAQYPDDVAGMVLLDSSSPDQFELISTMSSEFALTRRVVALLPSLSRLGLGHLVPASFVSRLPQPAADQVRALATSPQGLRNQRDEQAAIPALFRQAQALTGLGDRPLVVVTALDHDEVGWREAQDRLAALSTNSSHRFAPTDHPGILDDEAGATDSVHAIEDVVTAIRAGASLARDR